MSSTLIATFSGVRFKIDSNDTTVAHSYVAAFARYITRKGVKSVIVGYDGRESAHEYLPAVLSALTAFKIRFIGCVPTPTVQQLVKNTPDSAGVIYTASHNDASWGGLKFVDTDSIFLDPVNCQAVYSDL